jgi:hypothetical protein
MPAKAGIRYFEVFAWDRAAAAYWIVRPVYAKASTRPRIQGAPEL